METITFLELAVMAGVIAAAAGGCTLLCRLIMHSGPGSTLRH